MSEKASQITVENLYDLKETIAGDIFEGVVYPWEVLPKIHDFIIELGKRLPGELYEEKGENIWIAKSATVAPTACLNGPLIVGKGAVVGNSTELKNVILFNKVQVPHYNYVGDSILGFKSHMGAGSITSNVKSDKTPVVIHNGDTTVETGLKKMGAMLGDCVEVGCNSVLNPGTVIGKNSNVYPTSMVRGVVPAGHIYKSKTEIAEKY